MTYIDATFVEQIFDISKREREPNIKHHSQADDLKRRLEVAKWGIFCHSPTLRNRPAPLKRLSSDKTIACLRCWAINRALPPDNTDNGNQLDDTDNGNYRGRIKFSPREDFSRSGYSWSAAYMSNITIENNVGFEELQVEGNYPAWVSA